MYKKYFKRFLDLIVAFVALVFFAPLFIAVAVAVKISSSGPVFFRQERGGKNKKYFRIFKFRSMAIDPDAEKKGFEPGSATRITLVGRLLRKTKIDELPQLLNVIRGEMSIVGPRPEVKCYIELYPERWSKILEVSPGITDPASVIFRNEEEILKRAEDPEEKYRLEILPGKLKLYEKYVDDITFRKDFGIIIDTIKALFSVR